MTVQEMSDQITQKLFKTDAASVAACKGFIRRRYRMLYDGSLWKDTLEVSSNIAASTNVITLPESISLLIGVRWNNCLIDPVELSFLLRIDPSAFERVGTPVRVAELPPIGMSANPATAEAFTFVSSSASDVALTFLLRGELSGVPQYEEITLNGTTPVTSTKSWTKVTTASKAVTTGTVTVAGATSATTYLTLWPEETEKKYLQIQLFSSPADTTKTILALGKKRFQDLVKNQDSPIIRGIENALLAYAEADMLQRERQYGKATAKVEEAGAMLAVAKDMGIHQSMNIVCITPDPNGEWNRNDFDAGTVGYNSFLD